tara:strand:- start:2578 stop:2850 length:273 start_codon:yes stop_codon:yes gene_type:complete
MNNLYIFLSIILILLISNIHLIRKKDKFRINLLIDGVVNKILLGFLLLIFLFENFLLGMLFMVLLLILQSENIKKTENIEGFYDYYKNIC